MQPWVYIVLLGVFAIAYALKLPARSREGTAEKRSLKETEAALELYVADIERENEEMIRLVSGIKQQSLENQSALQEQLNELRAQLTEQQQKSTHIEARVAAGETGMLQLAFSHKKDNAENKHEPVNEKLPTPQSVKPEVQPEVLPEPINSIKMRYPKLFELDEQGKSIDAIAKLTGLQRGEVQLILQLAKQEEST
ncbi:hypothetical protein [Paenibacillus wynnii]|uniref:Uncharacterized protein n=1 Tax=Paenibacillus wynnii TaxID=268407 RepID=A0A098M4M1_9BACL|nr:hypothetical protein [Paenibacillus wynnii]KGE17499.1 hypothetical protein PWYN_23125 [Paenibacillus wynnii]